MSRARTVCSTPNCPNPCDRGRCEQHRREADQARGSSTQRGYARNPGHRHFRAQVLARDPVCVICHNSPSIIADHWPADRRQLVARGLDPNDPAAGRGLCRSCDSKQTAQRQPGGWNAR